MSQDLMKRTYQSFSLPLYALIHDSIVQALQQAQLSKQDTVNLLQAIPKLPLNPKEQNELENAKGAIELEDSFGSGNFFVVDADSQEAFVFTDQQNADYVNRLLNKQSGQQVKQSQQDQQGQQSDQQSTKIQAESVQVQTASNPPTQIQQNQGTDTDLLVKMMLLQQNQPSHQQVMQQVALLDLIKEKDVNELLKLMQISQIMKFNQPQQEKENQSTYAQKQKDKQQSNGQQGQQQPLDTMQMLQELQLMNVLQRQK